MLPRDFTRASDADREGPLRFCGPCRHFEVWTLGGGGNCQKGHDPQERARAGHCPDRHESARGDGPGFDLSE